MNDIVSVTVRQDSFWSIYFQIPPDQLRGSNVCSTAMANEIWSTLVGTMRVLCSHCIPDTLVAVALAYPHSSLKDIVATTVLRNMRPTQPDRRI